MVSKMRAWLTCSALALACGAPADEFTSDEFTSDEFTSDESTSDELASGELELGELEQDLTVRKGFGFTYGTNAGAGLTGAQRSQCTPFDSTQFCIVPASQDPDIKIFGVYISPSLPFQVAQLIRSTITGFNQVFNSTVPQPVEPLRLFENPAESGAQFRFYNTTVNGGNDNTKTRFFLTTNYDNCEPKQLTESLPGVFYQCKKINIHFDSVKLDNFARNLFNRDAVLASYRRQIVGQGLLAALGIGTKSGMPSGDMTRRELLPLGPTTGVGVNPGDICLLAHATFAGNAAGDTFINEVDPRCPGSP